MKSRVSGIEDWSAKKCAANRQHVDPIGHVPGGRHDRPGRPDIFDITIGYRDRVAVVIDHMGLRHVPFVKGVVQSRRRAIHFEWLEEFLCQVIVPRHVVHLGYELARREEHQVSVLELVAETLGDRHVGQPFDQLLPVVAGAVPDLLRYIAESAVVGEQVADSDLRRHPRVGHFEFRPMCDDVVIPLDQALIDEFPDRGRRERLRRRADRKDRIRAHFFGLAGFLDAVTLDENRFAVLHDRDREARNLPILHAGRDVLVEVFRRFAGEARGGHENAERQNRKGLANGNKIAHWEVSPDDRCARCVKVALVRFDNATPPRLDVPSQMP